MLFVGIAVVCVSVYAVVVAADAVERSYIHGNLLFEVSAHPAGAARAPTSVQTGSRLKMEAAKRRRGI